MGSRMPLMKGDHQLPSLLLDLVELVIDLCLLVCLLCPLSIQLLFFAGMVVFFNFDVSASIF